MKTQKSCRQDLLVSIQSSEKDPGTRLKTTSSDKFVSRGSRSRTAATLAFDLISAKQQSVSRTINLMCIGLLGCLSLRLCTPTSLLRLLAVTSAWRTERSSLTREPPINSAAAKLPWHTNHIRPPSVTWQLLHCFVPCDLLLWGAYPTSACNRGWSESLGSRAYLVFDRSGFNTCVQPPPSNIRYLLATDTIVNRF